MRFSLLSVTLAVLLCTPNVVWGQGHTISDCSRAAQSEINTAYVFITQNLEAILTKSGLRDKKKTKVRNQWPSVKIVCVDQKPTCKTQGNLGKVEGEVDEELDKKLGRKYIWLHAAELGFQHPRTGARVTVRVPLPAPLLDFLSAVGVSCPKKWQ